MVMIGPASSTKGEALDSWTRSQQCTCANAAEMVQSQLLIRVHRTGGNGSGNCGNRCYRSGPVPVPIGSQPVQIQNLNLNSKNEKNSQNSQKYFKVCRIQIFVRLV
jgi:hypothetical protein